MVIKGGFKKKKSANICVKILRDVIRNNYSFILHMEKCSLSFLILVV